MRYISKSILKKPFVKEINGKKRDFGKLVIVGSSETYSGSPALAAMAAYKIGVDVVHIISPKRAANIIASFSPEMITHAISTKFFMKKTFFKGAQNNR